MHLASILLRRSRLVNVATRVCAARVHLDLGRGRDRSLNAIIAHKTVLCHLGARNTDAILTSLEPATNHDEK